MAMVQFGGGISSIHGSIGGSSFVRSKGGTIWKSKSGHPMGTSASAEQKRNVNIALARIWTYILSETERQAWHNYTRTKSSLSGNWTLKQLKGKSSFQAANFFIAIFNLPLIMTPPADSAIGTATNAFVTPHSITSGGLLTGGISATNITSADKAIIEVTAPQRPGIKSVTSKYVILQSLYTPNSGISWNADYEDIIGSLPSAGGQRIFVRGRILRTTTGITSPAVSTSELWS